MRITEFNSTVTAKQLNESVAQQFGQKLNLESFSLEQLYDARNKLRTKLSQFESRESFNAVYESEEFQKNKLFLDVLNRAIDERLAEDTETEFSVMEQMVLDKVNEGVIEFTALPEELQEKAISAAGTDEDLAESAPKGWEGTVKGMKKHRDDIDNPWALAHWMKNKGYKSHQKESVSESVLSEGEEEKAELIMAARDMVDRITNWMEDTANMQAEKMLQLVDQIRDEVGSDVAQEFESIAKPALATIYTALEASRQQLTSSVQLLTGEADTTQMMGEPVDGLAGDELAGDELAGDELAGDELAGDELGDEFGADAAAAGGEEAAGRMTRESVEYSRRLASILAPKKK